MVKETNTSPARQQNRSRLAIIRERNGVSLQQVAESTKISPRFLRAIEAERFEELPGGILSRSYLRQYATAIGFDEDELLAWYYERTGDRPVAPKPAQPARPQKRSALDWFRSLNPIRLF